MEQSAVEWVLEQFETINTQRKWKEIIEQAKEMEKKQIIDAMDVTQRTDFYVKYEGSEQYYNETFKKK
jgi:NurA-like 5'-3' nuclease